MTPEPLLREPDVRRLLGISPATLWRLRKRGLLRAVRLGKAVRFRHQDVERLIESAREPAPVRRRS